MDFKEEIKAYFTAWENALIKIFENKYSKGEALPSKSPISEITFILVFVAIFYNNLYKNRAYPQYWM